MMLNPKKYELTLLSEEEFLKYRDLIPPIWNWWWLKTPAQTYLNFAEYVTQRNDVFYDGAYVINYYGVRPALKSREIQMEPGEHFSALGNEWIVLDAGVAISEREIGRMKFDERTNLWERSELKRWLEEWGRVRNEQACVRSASA